MAVRPIFIPNDTIKYKEINIEFKWHGGFAVSQKKKNIIELHNQAKLKGYNNILEVSSKSDLELGKKLSAFNLKIDTPKGKISIESAFQGSKVFENYIQFEDIYLKNSLEAKKDIRLKNSGKIIEFNFFGDIWENEPKTAFYDWLYISALYPYKDYLYRNLLKFDGFSDIEFNPKKSINCQARSCAILSSLLKENLLDKAMINKENFIKIVYNKNNYRKREYFQRVPKQKSLFI